MTRTFVPRTSLVAALGLALTGWLLSAPSALADSPSYSARATALTANVLGVQTVAGDTGPVPSSGGAQDAALLSESVPGLVTADVLDGSAVAGGGQSNSHASLADLSLTIGGNNVKADFLMARANASCGSGTAAAAGDSELAGLTVNNMSESVSGAPNQTIYLTPDNSSYVVINEQQSSAGSMTVNALHVHVSGVGDVVVASAHSDIHCPSPAPASCSSNTPNDRITGGGWVAGTQSGGRGNFGAAGGYQNDGSLWGHLTYIDHGNGMKVKGDRVTGYGFDPNDPSNPLAREITGVADVTNPDGTTSVVDYFLDLADYGEPGAGHDHFKLKLSNGYIATGNYNNTPPLLNAGNLKLHKPISCP
jgi:hypothetical protein